LAEIVQAIKDRHRISDPFDEVRLEDEYLTFYFSRQRGASTVVVTTPAGHREEVRLENPPIARRSRRRARKRRNRMKTRGWDVVTKISNRGGQTAVIYKPFVDALAPGGLTSKEKRTRVEGILRANGNKPSPASVDYFLENTLEYLATRKVAEASST